MSISSNIPLNKKMSVQLLDFNRSVRIAAICHSGPITAISTNEQFLVRNEHVQNFISISQKLVRVYADRQAYGNG